MTKDVKKKSRGGVCAPHTLVSRYRLITAGVLFLLFALVLVTGAVSANPVITGPETVFIDEAENNSANLMLEVTGLDMSGTTKTYFIGKKELRQGAASTVWPDAVISREYATMDAFLDAQATFSDKAKGEFRTKTFVHVEEAATSASVRIKNLDASIMEFGVYTGVVTSSSSESNSGRKIDTETLIGAVKPILIMPTGADAQVMAIENAATPETYVFDADMAGAVSVTASQRYGTSSSGVATAKDYVGKITGEITGYEVTSSQALYYADTPTTTAQPKTYIFDLSNAPGDTYRLNDGSYGQKFVLSTVMLIKKDTLSESYFTTVQEAVNAAEDGDTVKLLSNVDVSSPVEITKNITIDGNDKTLTSTDCAAIWIKSDLSSLEVKNLKIQGAYSPNIPCVVDGKYIACEAMEAPFMGIGTYNLAYSVDSLTINDVEINGFDYGLYFNSLTSNTDPVKITANNLAVKNCYIKGAYFEKLTASAFTACTFENNGHNVENVNDGVIISSANNWRTWMAGVDINLKFNTFENIVFTNCKFTNNGANRGTALHFKARGTGTDTSSYSATPASLVGVSVSGCEFSGNNDIEVGGTGAAFGPVVLGEPGKGNLYPTEVSIQDGVGVTDNRGIVFSTVYYVIPAGTGNGQTPNNPSNLKAVLAAIEGHTVTELTDITVNMLAGDYVFDTGGKNYILINQTENKSITLLGTENAIVKGQICIHGSGLNLNNPESLSLLRVNFDLSNVAAESLIDGTSIAIRTLGYNEFDTKGHSNPHNVMIKDCNFVGNTTGSGTYFIDAKSGSQSYNFTIADSVFSQGGGTIQGYFMDWTIDNIIAVDNIGSGINWQVGKNLTVVNSTISSTKYATRIGSSATEGVCIFENNTLGSASNADATVIIRIVNPSAEIIFNNNILTQTGTAEIFENKTTSGLTNVDLSYNYWNGTNPISKAETYNVPAASLVPYYTRLNADGTIDESSLTSPVMLVKPDGTSTHFATVQAAVNAAGAGDTVKITSDLAGNGVIVQSGNSITFDLNGFTYDVDGETVGSVGTETEAFQLLKDSTITIKNGTITSSKAKILIQNYADLTLDNVTLDGTNLIGASVYTLSNNNGHTILKGDTVIIAHENGVAFDSYNFTDLGYSGVTVTIQDDVFINGPFESNGDTGSDAGTIIIKGGSFTQNPTGYLAPGYAVITINGIYCVVEATKITGPAAVTAGVASIFSIADGNTVSCIWKVNDVVIPGFTGKSVEYTFAAAGNAKVAVEGYDADGNPVAAGILDVTVSAAKSVPTGENVVTVSIEATEENPAPIVSEIIFSGNDGKKSAEGAVETTVVVNDITETAPAGEPTQTNKEVYKEQLPENVNVQKVIEITPSNLNAQSEDNLEQMAVIKFTLELSTPLNPTQKIVVHRFNEGKGITGQPLETTYILKEVKNGKYIYECSANTPGFSTFTVSIVNQAADYGYNAELNIFPKTANDPYEVVKGQDIVIAVDLDFNDGAVTKVGAFEVQATVTSGDPAANVNGLTYEYSEYHDKLMGVRSGDTYSIAVSDTPAWLTSDLADLVNIKISGTDALNVETIYKLTLEIGSKSEANGVETLSTHTYEFDIKPVTFVVDTTDNIKNEVGESGLDKFGNAIISVGTKALNTTVIRPVDIADSGEAWPAMKINVNTINYLPDTVKYPAANIKVYYSTQANYADIDLDSPSAWTETQNVVITETATGNIKVDITEGASDLANAKYLKVEFIGRKLGDVRDGYLLTDTPINVLDLSAILNEIVAVVDNVPGTYVTGGFTEIGANMPYADINKDGSIAIQDALLLLNHISA